MFVISRDEYEGFDGDYPTRAAAVAAAPVALELDPGDCFYVGEKHMAEVPLLDGEEVLDMLRSLLEGDFDDVDDEFECTAAQSVELALMIDGTIKQWMAKHSISIRNFNVEEVEEHEAPDPEPAT